MQVVPLGRILDPVAGLTPWIGTHAVYPTPVMKSSNVIRIFFVSRDTLNRGRPGWCDVRADQPTSVVAISSRPLFEPGLPGAFDDSGISIGNVVRVDRQWRMYYMGWNRLKTVPFHNSIGLATGNSLGKIHQAFVGPILERSRHDPFSLSYPFVSRARGQWTMYYGTHRGTGLTEETMKHVISVAISRDGVNWRTLGEDVVGLKPDEFAVSRPWIIPVARPMMLLTIYGKHRRIGFARQSKSGRWERAEDDIVPRSKNAWASVDVCYASHIRSAGRDYVFYCGNDYGRTGFGVAELRV